MATEEKNVKSIDAIVSQLETEKRLLHDLVWACPLPELRAFVGFFVRISQANQVEQGRKLLAWADDVELMRS